MPFEEDFLPSQPDHQVFTTTDNKESDDNLDLLQTKHLLLNVNSAKVHPHNKNRLFPQPTSWHTQSSKNPKPSQSSHIPKPPSAPSIPSAFLGSISSQPKQKRKRRTPSLIDIELDNKHERSSYKKRQKEKLVMAEVVIEGKRIDTKIQKKDQELQAAEANQSEKNAQRCHELYLFELKDRRIEVKSQAEKRRIEADEHREKAKQRIL